MLRLIPLARISPIFATFAFIHIVNVARADTLKYTFNVPQQTPNWTQAVDVPRFDPALGKLTAVNVEFDKHVRWSMSLTVTQATSQYWEVIGEMNASVVTTLEYATSGVDLCAELYREPTFNFWIDERTYPLPYTVLESGEADRHAAGSVPAIDLGLWVGSGNIPLTLKAVGTSSHNATTTYSIPGSISWYLQSAQTVSVAGVVTMEYTP